jgi:alkylation response protein AidB-like acyl-CoA dehydrogenase
MYGLSAADLEVQERARTFADELIPYEVEAEMNNGELPPEVVAAHRARVAELGLGATNIPKEFGGQGLSYLQQVLVQEQGGRVTNALGWEMYTPPLWFTSVATPEQLERYLAPVVANTTHECYAITEEFAGSDVEALQATATPVEGGYRLNGVKWHVTSYNHAGYAFFQAKLTAGAHTGEHAMFIVDLPNPRVRVVRTPAYSHTFSHHHPIVAFEDVEVPTGALVGKEGDGMSFSYDWFRYERLMIAARCLGAADRLISEGTDFAAQRIVQGRPLVEFQAVQALLADSVTELFAARAMTYEVARSIDAGADVKVQHAQCSMIKLFTSEMANRVADRMVQVFGGRGYMRENVAERFFRELRVERIWEGTSEIQRTVIAGQLVKRGVHALT